ncbi:MAG: hypothetical protein OXM58_13385 [Rhodospirillaceae bacterium]|nr:hypothetical protein [Rhodospirillaceae bacterium]
MLRLLEDVVQSGRHVAIMAHFNHWQELQTNVVREAIRRIRDTGAVIRGQAPLLAHINNDPDIWARLWREQVRLGIIPYYMFVERDTGAKRYTATARSAATANIVPGFICLTLRLGR